MNRITLSIKLSVARDCAARGAAIYGAEGICKFICDILSETYMSDILYRAQARIEERTPILPCVLHPDRILCGKYPRLKTYSDLWQRKNSNFEMIPREVPQGTQVNVFLSTYVGSVARCSIAIFAPTLVIERKSCSLRCKMRYICSPLLFTLFNA